MTIFYLFLNHQTDPVLLIYQYHIQSEKISNLKNNRYNKKAPARPIDYPQIGQARAYRGCLFTAKTFYEITFKHRAIVFAAAWDATRLPLGAKIPV